MASGSPATIRPLRTNGAGSLLFGGNAGRVVSDPAAKDHRTHHPKAAMDTHEQTPMADVPNETPAPTSQPGQYDLAPMPTVKRRWPVFVVGVLAGAAVTSAVWGVATAGSSSGSGNGSTFTLNGKMTLNGSCGFGGYSDIGDGASVTVYNPAGTVIGTGQLTNENRIVHGCTYDVSVPNVPGGEKFYQIEITHRGKVTFPADDAKAGKVSLTLGD